MEQGAPPAHNLPRQLTSFFGRDEVVKEIADLIAVSAARQHRRNGRRRERRASHRRWGRKLLSEFPDGVWFVELAPLSDPALVPHALAAALRVQESPRRPLLETLARLLGTKTLA